MAKKNGGVDVEVETKVIHRGDDTLFAVVNRLFGSILFPDPNNSAAPLFHRIKTSIAQNGPLFPEASRNTGRSVLAWTRQGSPLRALLVISCSCDTISAIVRSPSPRFHTAAKKIVRLSLHKKKVTCRVLHVQDVSFPRLILVGTITLLALTGLLVFMLFFLAATFNAIVISLLLSLAAAGGFLALFFTCVAAIYIGALSVAIFVISTTTISAIVAVLITTGWIGFFWFVWLASKKSLSLAKHSLSKTGSTISAYSYGMHADKASG